MTDLVRTGRIVLRAWRPTDVDAFLDVYGRDDVARWLGPQPRRAVADAAEAAARLQRWVDHCAGLDAPFGLWAVVLADDAAEEQADRPVGTVLLLPLSDADGPTGDVEVGWHLHPAVQGRGLATEATRALLDLARTAGTATVLALTDLDNTASQAVARRLGMHDDGTTDRWFGLTMRQFSLVL